MTEMPIEEKGEHPPLGKAAPASGGPVQLPESGLFLEKVLAHTPMMAVFLDPQFNFIWVNRAYAEACRQPPSFFPGRNHFDLYPHDENQAIFQRVVDTGEPFSVESKPFEFPDQPERGVTYWDWNLIPDKDGAGNVTGLIFTLAEVTKRFQAAEALRASEERFRLAFHTSPDSINLNRLEDGMYIDINQGFTHILGYTRQETMGKTSLALNIWKNPLDRERLTDGLRKNGVVENLEARFVAKDGTIRDGLMSARILKINGENVILSITRNITERKQAEDALGRRAEFEKLAAEISSKLAGVAGSGIDSAIDGALAALGTFIGGDRAYVFQFNNGRARMDNTHEWCAGGIDPQIGNLQDISIQEELPWFDQQIRNRDVFYVPDVASLPAEARLERSHFEIQGIRSLIVFPLRTAGLLTGFLGFDAVRQRRTWNDDHQSILRLVGETFAHVIDRDRKDRVLRESEEKFRLLVENTRDIIYSLDTQGRFLYASPSVEKLMGYTPDEVVGRSFSEFIHPDHLPFLIERFDGVLKGNELSSDYQIIDKWGGVRWVHSSTSPTTENGRVVRLQGVLHDIADRIAAEEALRESEAKYRTLVENANDAIFVAQDDRIKFPNCKTEKLTGYTAEELKQMPFADLIHPLDRASVLDRYRRRIGGENPVSEYSFRIFHKSGSERTVQLNTIRVAWEARPATLNFVRDITHQVELESRLIQSQKMESIGTLAGGVAHDFNNILFPIVGLSELLTEDLPPDSLEHENAREILTAAKRGRDLVKQILAFSRQSEPQIKPVRVQNIINDALKLARSTIPADIEIAQEIQGNCGLLMADPTQLHQIVMNLITNAYHALEPRGGTIAVTLEETVLAAQDLNGHALDPGPYARISVSDTGCGMDSDVMNKIFEPYFTTKAQGKGTGLGLAVVYGIVRKHGGAITVHSEGGHGTTFNVYLPLMAGLSEPASAMGGGSRESGNERILLVDDEQSIVRVVTQMLERLGYRVTACTSSMDALDVFRANPGSFDLVITDMTMPNMTGDQLVRELIAVRPGIPVVISTGFSERINKDRATEIGIRGFLMKPVSISEMARVVRSVLDAEWRET